MKLYVYNKFTLFQARCVYLKGHWAKKIIFISLLKKENRNLSDIEVLFNWEVFGIYGLLQWKAFHI